MKNRKIRCKWVRLIICIVLVVSVIYGGESGVYAASEFGNAENDKRACWISYLDIEAYLRDLTEEEFCLKLSDMYDRLQENHINTVLIHVRAFGDAIYPSSLFPQAEYISSDRRALDYDAFSLMISMAHDRGLSVEAWINPYRLSKDDETTASYRETEQYSLYRDFSIEYTNSDGQTAISLDPAREETIRLILDGVGEILERYDVDGIHFDDYFYMTGMADELDVETKKTYVNRMVAEVYRTVKQYNPSCTFGISPAGNTDNARAQGADIDRWLSEAGYVDYIMPQIYWSDVYQSEEGMCAMFSDRCREWAELNALDIPIYAGLALYRVGEVSSYDLGWSQSERNLMTQYQTAYGMGYDGYALFRYAWLEVETSSNVAAAELQYLRDYVEILPEPEKLPDGEFDGKAEETVPEEPFNYNANSFVSYSEGYAALGWQPAQTDGAYSATEENRVCALRMAIGYRAGQGGIRYRVYGEDGWQAWAYDGDIAGDMQELSGIRGVQIELYGMVKAGYDVFYRVYCCEDGGWLFWTRNGGTAGSSGYDCSINKLQVLLVPKGDFLRCYNYTINMWSW